MNLPPGDLPRRPLPTNLDTEALAEGHRASFRDRFAGVLIALGIVIALLVVLTIIGAVI
jgi:hypothetical protein